MFPILPPPNAALRRAGCGARCETCGATPRLDAAPAAPSLLAINKATLAARARTGKFVCVELRGRAHARLGTSAGRGDFTPWTEPFPTSELVDRLDNFK